MVLRRGASVLSPKVRRRTYQVLAGYERPDRYRRTLADFLAADPELLDAETISVLVERDLSSTQVEAFMTEAESRCEQSAASLDPALPSLCEFLSSYGAGHPSQYRRLRGFFTRAVMTAPHEDARRLAADGKSKLAQGFRIWLGAPSRIAVDPETGLWRPLHVWVAHDVGRAINPQLCAGQIEGGVYMGLGEALMEEQVFRRLPAKRSGALVHRIPSMLEYKSPTAHDMPEVVTELVETDEPNGPFGAKEVGQGPLLPMMPAVANAVFDAVGVRVVGRVVRAGVADIALAVVVSLQTVGVALMVAMLVTPAATAYLLTRRLWHMMTVGAIIGGVSSVAGLYLSFYINVASGAAVVLVSTAFFVVAFLGAPRRGAIAGPGVWKAVRPRSN